jgi:hypothetical protein
MIFKRIILVCILFVLNTALKAHSTSPWIFNEDFSTVNIYGGLPQWDISDDRMGALNWWPDTDGNAQLNGSTLGFVAYNETDPSGVILDQNGVIFLRGPTDYGNRNDASSSYHPTWAMSNDTLLHPGWTATFKVNLNPFISSTPGGIVEGGLLVSLGARWIIGDGTYPAPRQTFWAGFGINDNGRKYFCTEMTNTGTAEDYYNDVDVNASELFIKVQYDTSDFSLKSYYTTDLNNPGSSWDQPFRSASIDGFNDILSPRNFPDDFRKAVQIGVGGYSSGTTVSQGTVTIDDFNFNLVPEPSVLSLGIVGLAGLFILRRRRS